MAAAPVDDEEDAVAGVGAPDELLAEVVVVLFSPEVDAPALSQVALKPVVFEQVEPTDEFEPAVNCTGAHCLDR